MLFTPVQAPAPPAPQAPQAPQAPGTPAPIGVVGPDMVFRVPTTAAEQAILQAQREALSRVLANVRDRRASIARSYERASGANRTGLEEQLRMLDQRILQIEANVAEATRVSMMSNVQTRSIIGPPQFLNLSSGQVTGISIVFILFVLGPLAGSIGRLFWRRAAKPAMPPGWSEAAQRLERLEQAVDTIAVEVERVSEGQRFMTKLMTQAPTAARANVQASEPALNGGQPLPALGPGSPEPVVVQNQREEVRVRRG